MAAKTVKVKDLAGKYGLSPKDIVKELQELTMQLFRHGDNLLNSLKTINISVNTDSDNSDVMNLFESRTEMMAKAFCALPEDVLTQCGKIYNTVFFICTTFF